MGILNRTSDGLASVLVALYRALSRFGPTERDKLLDQLVPVPLSENKKNLTSPTLRRWTQFGLFKEDDKGNVSIADDCRCPGAPTDDLEWLRATARRLVLQTTANDDLLETEPSFGADFTRALCWSLAQDAHGFPGGGYDGGVSALEQSQVHGQPGIFQNSTRWDGFRDWACFLGFGWWGVGGRGVFVLDPTEAVEARLSLVFGSNEELPIDAFVESLAEVLPVMDRGDYRSRVEELITTSWTELDVHQVSTSLSRALLRLTYAGVVQLERRSDAPPSALLGRDGRTIREVSHIRREAQS